MFKQKGLQIIIECNLNVVNYFYVTFNLKDGSYRPYRKANEETHYIHIQLDHPPSITKHLYGPSKRAYHSYHDQKKYFAVRYHIMSNVQLWI